MSFPTLKYITLMKLNAPNKILIPPIKVKVFKDLTLFEQGHSHVSEIGIYLHNLTRDYTKPFLKEK
jgi:hypothetical protein